MKIPRHHHRMNKGKPHIVKDPASGKWLAIINNRCPPTRVVLAGRFVKKLNEDFK